MLCRHVSYWFITVIATRTRSKQNPPGAFSKEPVTVSLCPQIRKMLSAYLLEWGKWYCTQKKDMRILYNLGATDTSDTAAGPIASRSADILLTADSYENTFILTGDSECSTVFTLKYLLTETVAEKSICTSRTSSPVRLNSRTSEDSLFPSDL